MYEKKSLKIIVFIFYIPVPPKDPVIVDETGSERTIFVGRSTIISDGHYIAFFIWTSGVEFHPAYTK